MGGQGTQSKRKAPNGCKEFFFTNQTFIFSFEYQTSIYFNQTFEKRKSSLVTFQA
jgi:hypothetical protein